MPDQSDFWDLKARQERLFKLVENLKVKEEIRILFICNGNICRSPYAEMRFEKMLSDELDCGKKILVSSGGFIKNKQIHDFTRDALLDVGVSISRIEKFCPKALRKENKHYLENADLILAMGKMHISVLLAKKYRHKAFLLSELNNDDLMEIEDPALIKSKDRYWKLLFGMDKYLSSLVKLLKKYLEC
ncbi:MAG: arsenate reductase/protein-tyrosine-phosphatase family protein [Promethearchaeota archaeon]